MHQNSSELQNLSVTKFQNSDESVVSALCGLIAHINALTSILLPDDRSDHAKSRFLRKAISCTKWGFFATSHLLPNQSYQWLFSLNLITQ